jgi:ABC-2 type transport system ATP-binding protein
MLAISTRTLSKRYGRTLALDELDLDVEQGEVYGYLGPNGAGKTTTLRLLLGLHRPTTGTVQLLGIDALRDPVAAHRRLAYVAGEPALWPALTATETFEFLSRLRGEGGVHTSYRRALIERFQLDPERKVRTLSKGNRQKVALIAALSTRAELLLLDEPTSGLDPLMEVAFRDCIQEARDRGQTVFLSSHILSEVEALCDRVGILRGGRLVDQGTLAELRHLGGVTLDVTFVGAEPELPPLPGISVQRNGAAGLRFEVASGNGALDSLLRVLASHPVASLASHEPSLEEIFLHHYDESDGLEDRRGAA